jgi:hypothetical protein
VRLERGDQGGKGGAGGSLALVVGWMSAVICHRGRLPDRGRPPSISGGTADTAALAAPQEPQSARVAYAL